MGFSPHGIKPLFCLCDMLCFPGEESRLFPTLYFFAFKIESVAGEVGGANHRPVIGYHHFGMKAIVLPKLNVLITTQSLDRLRVGRATSEITNNLQSPSCRCREQLF